MNGKRFISTLVGCVMVGVIGATLKTTDVMADSPTIIDQAMEINQVNIKSRNSIAIPGFTSLTFKKDQLNQSVNFRNPDINKCYFKLTLTLPDGEVLWKSDFLAPGENVTSIVLNRTLEAGVYEHAKLIYSCFSLDTLAPLNGARISFELNVV